MGPTPFSPICNHQEGDNQPDGTWRRVQWERAEQCFCFYRLELGWPADIFSSAQKERVRSVYQREHFCRRDEISEIKVDHVFARAQIGL